MLSFLKTLLLLPIDLCRTGMSLPVSSRMIVHAQNLLRCCRDCPSILRLHKLHLMSSIRNSAVPILVLQGAVSIRFGGIFVQLSTVFRKLAFSVFVGFWKSLSLWLRDW